MLTNHSIVIKNQFMNKRYPTRHKTPSSFVTSYMARDDATMTVYPASGINAFDDDSVFKLMADKLIDRRENFDERVPTDKSWDALTNLEGRSFDNNFLSMSRKSIKDGSNAVQEAYDAGHSVHKLIFSFDNQYLQDLNVEKPGSLDFRNTVDEMKLRIASREGVKALADALGYVQPIYIGCVQLDRDHPHCHIVLVETAPKRLSHAEYRVANAERGIVTGTMRRKTCMAIDQKLNELKDLTILPSNGIRHAQELMRIYSDTYATLPAKKALVMQSAYEKDEYSPYLASVSNSVAIKKHQSKAGVKSYLSSQVSRAPKSSRLPPIWFYQRQPLGVKSNSVASRIAKMQKLAKRRLKLALERERQLNKAQVILARYRINYPNVNVKYLRGYILTLLVETAAEVDKCRSYFYKTAQDIPQDLIDRFDAVSDLPNNSRLNHEIRMLNFIDSGVEAHIRGFINADGVRQAASGFLPKFDSYPLQTKPRKPIKLDDKKAKEIIKQLPDQDFFMSLLPSTREKHNVLAQPPRPSTSISLSQADKILNKASKRKEELELW